MMTQIKRTIIVTGWGWKEYAVAAAVALKALRGEAEVTGMSKRRLPEFVETEGGRWRKIIILGISLGGDEERLAAALRRHSGTKVVWISSLPMSESQKELLSPLLEVHQSDGGLFNGALVEMTGVVFGVDVKPFMDYAREGCMTPKSVPQYHDLIKATMYAYRNYRDDESYATAIRYLAQGVREECWSDKMRGLVAHYHQFGDRELIGRSEAMETLRERINLVAPHQDARVLIFGESGTGKETVALQIHNRSPRRGEPFLAFNCASVTPDLLESRFFGYEKGTFTGAEKQTAGLFECADGGTLFLDEIAELPLGAQGLLLRVLEEGRFMRLGGKEEIAANVRLISATNRNLPRMVKEGTFREDLFMRLNVIQLHIPPLRERPSDIGDVADNWWFNHFRRHLTAEQVDSLKSYDYPGNVRELFNILERAVVFKEEDFARLIKEHCQMNAGITRSDPANPALATGDDVPDELDEALRHHVRRVFRKYGENISMAAAALGITRNTLKKRLREIDQDAGHALTTASGEKH